MTDAGDETTTPELRSKFEWVPDDVTINSDEETAAILAEYEEWLAEQAGDAGPASSRDGENPE
jgi:hypothetical protein